MTILYFIIALGVLVLIHEWGHFIVARMSGILVEQFSIGFGPKLFSFKPGPTEYKICLLPLGGYVKLYGEDPIAEADGNVQKASEIAASPKSFAAKPLGKRLATVFAGPGMNLLLCLVLMPIVFIIGRATPRYLDDSPQVLGVVEGSPAAEAGLQVGDKILKINGDEVGLWSDALNWIMLHPGDEAIITVARGDQSLKIPVKIIREPSSNQEIGYLGVEPGFFIGNDPIVGEVQAGSPAFTSGLKANDVITHIDNQVVATWTAMTEIVRGSNGRELGVTFSRGGVPQSVKLKPKFDETNKAWLMGITKHQDEGLWVNKKYGFVDAMVLGTKENYKLFKMTGDVLGRLFTFRLSYKALGGPIQIAQATGAAARSGLGSFFYFLAFLSMQLGVLNLLPIPVLDGGHVLFMAIEGVRRKPLSLKIKTGLTQVGLILLLGLMVIISINDVDRVWGFRNILEKITGLF